MRRSSGLALGLFVLAAALSPYTASAQKAHAAAKLDLNQLMGSWFEVARYPDKAERQCVSDAVVLYALGDKPGHFQLVASCVAKDNYTDARNSSGKVANKFGDGRLRLGWFWPFRSKYWVFAVDPGYQWALVGNPNHKALWILSRTPTIDSATLSLIESQASAQGFNPGKLIPIPQKAPHKP